MEDSRAPLDFNKTLALRGSPKVVDIPLGNVTCQAFIRDYLNCQKRLKIQIAGIIKEEIPYHQEIPIEVSEIRASEQEFSDQNATKNNKRSNKRFRKEEEKTKETGTGTGRSNKRNTRCLQSDPYFSAFSNPLLQTEIKDAEKAKNFSGFTPMWIPKKFETIPNGAQLKDLNKPEKKKPFK